MFQKFIKIKFLAAVCAAILPFAVNVFGQSQWLDMKPLPGWNERKRTVLQTKKVSAAELKRCAVSVRQPTLPQDFLLTRKGWTLTGAAQIFGRTAVITAAEAFDGMCRPLKFDTFVFVGNRLAGTLSPGQMDSRTDGSLINVNLVTQNDITAEYARYRDSDALCCPYKTERVTFEIKPDGRNFLLVPEGKFDTSVGGGQSDGPNESTAGSLRNAVWRWTETQTPVEKITVDKPENYTLEFVDDKTVQVQADCNRGRGTYKSQEKSLTFGPIAMTRRACLGSSLDNRFLSQLNAARIFFFKDGDLYIDLMADGGTMRFERAPSTGGNTANLENSTWRWQSADGSKGKLTVDKPQNYWIEFRPNGDLAVKADCNGGGGKYQMTGNRLRISSLIRTQIFCGERSHDTRFVEGLEKARTFRIEGNTLVIESEGDTLRFSRFAGRS